MLPRPASAAGDPPAIPRAAGLRRADFDFDLPPELIAQHPAAQRAAARLLLVEEAQLRDAHIPELLEEVRPGDVLVLNDTRVIKARIFGVKESGGRVEALVERLLAPHRALVLLRASHPPRPGALLRLGVGPDRPDGFAAMVVERSEEHFILESAQPFETVLEAAGQLPLPPYIHHGPEAEDTQRYQTVYARAPGAIAAPTAGLHLDKDLLAQLRARGAALASITLHVGSGTFAPVRHEDLRLHRMHAERYEVPQETARLVNAALAGGGRVLAVGTTSVRALESNMRAGRLQAGAGETDIFILPGFRFQCVDLMLTNFHLPGSTLLMLVSAFAGTQRIRTAYRHAIAARYRFFSYGDAMLLRRAAADAPAA